MKSKTSNFNIINSFNEVNDKNKSFNCWEDDVQIKIGESTLESGKYFYFIRKS